MRILYLHQYFVPPQAPGGPRSYEFARRLIAHGHQVCVISSPAFFPTNYHFTGLITQTEVAGTPMVIIRVPYSNSMSFAERIHAFLQFAFLASWEAMRHPADVVFATSTPLTIAIPAILAKLWQRIPLVFEVRDLWPELPIAVGALRNPVAKALAEALEWLAYHASVHVIALSPGIAEGVMRRGMPATSITVIPNGCDVELFDVPLSQGQAIRRRLPGLAENQPLVVYAGTFGVINGVDYLVDVAVTMRTIASDVRFLLVGSGAKKDMLISKAQAGGVLNENLWIWDPVPRTEMPNVLAAATVATSLFIPLRPMWNNSANKFFDALAAGKPVAINYGGWQAELLTDSGAGIVLPPNDPVLAAETLSSFVHDPQRLQQAAAAARTLAYTRFHRDMLASKLEASLCQAAERR